MIPCAYGLFKNVRSQDCRNTMKLFQGFPTCGVPLVLCKPHVLLCAKSTALAAPDSLLSWRKQGPDARAANAAVRAKPVPALHEERSCCCSAQRGGLEATRVGRTELQQHTGTRGDISSRSAGHLSLCARTREPLGHRLRGAQSSAPATPELRDPRVPRARGPRWHRARPLLAAVPGARARAAHTRYHCGQPQANLRVGILVLYKIEKAVGVSGCEWDTLSCVSWWLCDISAIYFAFI